MAEHRVRKDNIIYIIPTDELFIKWERSVGSSKTSLMQRRETW